MSIMIVGMLDERDDAIKLIKQEIENRGHQTIVADISLGKGAAKPSVKADLGTPDLIFTKAAESARQDLWNSGDREIRASLMSKGLSDKVMSLHKSGEIDGIIAIGGMTGTLIALKAMKVLPFGFPKVLISSAAALPAHAEQLAEYFGSMDVTVMHTVVDTVGLNHTVKALAINGAKAISGMVEGMELPSEPSKPLLAVTEFGYCDQGAHFLRKSLEPEHEIVFFHATGVSDRSLAALAAQGTFAAIIDLAPGTFSEWLLGGNRPSGEDRLDIARDILIPYILCPGGFDLISCGPMERKNKPDDRLWVSRRLAERKLYNQDDLRVQARMSPEESEQVAIAVAERLNEYSCKQRVKVVIPEKGFTSLSIENGPLHDPVADRAFITALENHLSKEIELIKIDTDINSREFADTVAKVLADAQRACR